MVENGKKRNRNRNKNKNKGGANSADAPAAEAAAAAPAAEVAPPKAESKPAEQPAKAQPAKDKKKSPSPPKEVKKATNGGVDIPVDNRSAEEKQADLIKNLAMDMPPFLSNFVELRAAEARFHAGVNGGVTNGNAEKVAERNSLFFFSFFKN